MLDFGGVNFTQRTHAFGIDTTLACLHFCFARCSKWTTKSGWIWQRLRVNQLQTMHRKALHWLFIGKITPFLLELPVTESSHMSIFHLTYVVVGSMFGSSRIFLLKRYWMKNGRFICSHLDHLTICWLFDLSQIWCIKFFGDSGLYRVMSFYSRTRIDKAYFFSTMYM